MRLVLLFLISNSALAGFEALDRGDQYQYAKPQVLQKVRVKSAARKRSNKGELKALLTKLESQDRKLADLLKKQEEEVIIRRKNDVVNPLTRMEGVVLNSVISTNQRPAKFIVKVTENGDLEEGELRCFGMTFNRRISSKCNLLVIDDKTYQVDVELWDLDGAEGIIPDHFYSGEEKSFLTSSVASFFSGVLDSAKDRIIIPFGEAERSNAKNKVLSGLLGVANNANSKIAEAGSKEMAIAFANSGKRVLIFFNEGVELNGGVR